METNELDRLLQGMLAKEPGASDFNFTVGRHPHVEVNGELRALPLGSEPLTSAQTRALAMALIGEHPALARTLEEGGSCDCAHALPDGRRLRANVFRVKGHHSIVLRALPGEIPSLEDLALPPLMGDIAELRNGLALVVGSTGSGKSTTLAALIDRINSTRSVHIVTLEDPVEFCHSQKKAILNQRDLELDFPSFAEGLRAALRQAPKVILVGEMRDRETIEIALKAAETGHLVLSTLHTIDAGQTINRIVGVFDQQERPLIRSRLAQTLKFVVGQRLLPRRDGGRVAALELMGSSLRIRDLIQNDEQGDKTFHQAISDAHAYGWQTFDQHIVDLYSRDLITEEIAKAYCSDLSAVSKSVDQIRAERGEETSDLGSLEMEKPEEADDWMLVSGQPIPPGERK